MTKMDKALRQKIQAMLTLADPERGGTEEERDTAMLMAQRLMAKHNIQAYELATEDERQRGITHRVYDVEGKTKKWEALLVHYIGASIGCKVVITDHCRPPTISPLTQKRTPATWHWRMTAIGTESDLEFLQMLYDALVPWLKSQASLAKKLARPHNPNAFNRAFYDNAGHTINLRLRHQREGLYNTSSTGKEVVKATHAATERYAQELFGHLRTSKARGYANEAGERAGREAGARADLTPGRKIQSTRRQLNS